MTTHSRMLQTRRRRKKDLKKTAREAKSQDKAANASKKKSGENRAAGAE